MTKTQTPEFEADARVHARRELATGVIGLELARTDGEDWPEWAAGAHIDLLLPDERVRQYSLAGSPRDRSVLEIAVLREEKGRGGSIWIHEMLRDGAIVRVRGPRNHFPLRNADRFLFIAAGIGITPILPMIESASDDGRPWDLVYCGRRRDSMAYIAELVRHGDSVTLYPRDETPRADLMAVIRGATPGTLVYACGPVPFLEAVEQACADAGVEAPITERFEAKSFDTSNDTAFEVEIASDGRVFEVPPGATILSVLKANGISVIASCQEGTCGTCETGLLAGVADHRDAVLTAAEQAENDYMMVCCSRSKSPRLLLDL